MKDYKNVLIGAVLLVVIVIAGYLVIQNDTGNELTKGSDFPTIELQNISGEEVEFTPEKGKVTLVNFWATWCTFCDKEMPDLQKLMDSYDDVEVVTIDVQESKEVVAKYIQQGGYTFHVYLDTMGGIAQKFMVQSFPTTYFIDKEGKIKGVVKHMMTYPQMVELVEQIRGQ